MGIRADGRGCFDSRNVVVDAGVLPQANGSAKVKLEGGGEDTVVLAAVKAEVGEPHADAPRNGNREAAQTLVYLSTPNAGSVPNVITEPTDIH